MNKEEMIEKLKQYKEDVRSQFMLLYDDLMNDEITDIPAIEYQKLDELDEKGIQLSEWIDGLEEDRLTIDDVILQKLEG